MTTDTEWEGHLRVDHGWSDVAVEHFRLEWKRQHKVEHDGSVRNWSLEGRPHSHPTGQLSPIELKPVTIDEIVHSLHALKPNELQDLINQCFTLMNKTPPIPVEPNGDTYHVLDLSGTEVDLIRDLISVQVSPEYLDLQKRFSEECDD